MKLTIIQLVKKFHIFRATRGFITVFTRTFCWTSTLIQLNLDHILSFRCILILSSDLHSRHPTAILSEKNKLSQKDARSRLMPASCCHVGFLLWLLFDTENIFLANVS
jgi:hypothetical protein